MIATSKSAQSMLSSAQRRSFDDFLTLPNSTVCLRRTRQTGICTTGFWSRTPKVPCKGQTIQPLLYHHIPHSFRARGRIQELYHHLDSLSREGLGRKEISSELFGILKQKRTIANPPKAMESIFARLLSLLAQYVTPSFTSMVNLEFGYS